MYHEFQLKIHTILVFNLTKNLGCNKTIHYVITSKPILQGELLHKSITNSRIVSSHELYLFDNGVLIVHEHTTKIEKNKKIVPRYIIILVRQCII